ncbi:MAG: ferrochelatase [Bacteroidota bacterium]|nr:ferrochelatase [Bacteroidota bacterium]
MNQNSDKTAVILINVGSPDNPEVKQVRRYLSEFLNDPRVIDLPSLLRKALVNLIIVPFRAPQSAKLYQRLWTKAGSPLLSRTRETCCLLQTSLGEEYEVLMAMRYGKPSLKVVLEEARVSGYKKIIFLPLYPQYASSTTGSALQLVYETIGEWNYIPELRMITQFYAHPLFIKAYADRTLSYNHEEYDAIIFSFHGLPNRHIHKIHPEISPNECNCTHQFPEHGRYCYKATCYETARLLRKELNLPESKCTVGFQSRISKNWLTPYTDEIIISKAREGVKSILVIAPSFTTDCLETTVEIGEEYQQLFINHGGETLTLVESLNSHPQWIEALKQIVINGL